MTMQNDPRRIDMPFEETTEKRDADEFLQDWMQDSLSCFEQEVADRCSECLEAAAEQGISEQELERAAGVPCMSTCDTLCALLPSTG
jgi:hypothetical protein